MPREAPRVAETCVHAFCSGFSRGGRSPGPQLDFRKADTHGSCGLEQPLEVRVLVGSSGDAEGHGCVSVGLYWCDHPNTDGSLKI